MWLSNEWKNKWSFSIHDLVCKHILLGVNWMHYGALDKLGKILGMWNCFVCVLGVGWHNGKQLW